MAVVTRRRLRRLIDTHNCSNLDRSGADSKKRLSSADQRQRLEVLGTNGRLTDIRAGLAEALKSACRSRFRVQMSHLPQSTQHTTLNMEFQRGERVNLNFETGGVEKLEPEDSHEPSMPSFPSFVGDILERESSPANPPTAPSIGANVNGFPAHKKRVPRVSAFKQQRAAKEKQAAADSEAPAQYAPLHARSAGSDLDAEKQSIDDENQTRLASMSEYEIAEERQELLSSLSPALLQKLLGRSNIDQGSNERDLFPPEHALPPATDDSREEPEPKSPSTKKVSFAPEPEHDAPSQRIEPTTPTPPVQPIPATTTDTAPQEASDSLHFPTARQPPDLDPNDPAFLKNLHDKYFPNLAYNPSALSWMAPIDPSDKSSPYHPSQTALNATELRFDFKGSLLAPSIARSLPSNRGLHHHSDAPEAAGYTIPELAVLSRSAVPAQRCMSYQTLGRILYRLGQGEYGVEKGKQDTDGPVKMASNPNTEEGESDGEEEDVGSAMAAGLWSCIDEGRIIDTLTEEANKERGHLTARTFAQEALWNWRRGGGRTRQAV
jgi:hypothetical protein